MTMIKKYAYDGKTYTSAWVVKMAIQEKENKRFGAEPSGTLEEKQTFWTKYGVTYTEEPDPEPTLEEVKTAKLNELERAFLQWYEQDATVTSSLGFVADSDVRAVTDVSGLITVATAEEPETREAVAFMDHNNEPHMLTLEQLETLQLEIIQNGQSAYQQKWQIRSTIEDAQDKETVEAIEVKFTGLDFTAEAA